MTLINKSALFLTTAAAVLALSGFAAAQGIEPGDEGYDSISVYATACEDIRDGEAKSSVRVRATDKASFKAVENISDLSEYRNSMPGQQFNVLVYDLADNYIEDLAVRTTEQTENMLCVEVTGYLNRENIAKVLTPEENDIAEAAKEDNSNYPESLVVETPEAAVQPAVLDNLPPKPEPEIKPEIAAETFITNNTAENIQETAQDGGAKVFIGKTKFFNDTESDSFYEDIKTVLEEKPEIIIVTDESQADYVLKPEVLRAKVDPINRQTNRLQMVIAAELLDRNNGTSLREHQNRFILFESSEDEQQVAADLVKKLLRKAGRQISWKIKPHKLSAGETAIITPAAASYRNKNQF